MNITECEGYKKLIAAIEHDEKQSPGFHDYRGKLDWIVARAEHYADKTGISSSDILDAWENDRDYWYMNYYHDSRQPEIKGDNVRVFDTLDALRDALGENPKFRCPSCKEISSNPYECDASDKCDWKSYGLFGCLGCGIYIFVKSELRGQKLFKPVAWESECA